MAVTTIKDVVLEPLVLPPEPPPITPGWKTSEGKLALVTMITAIAGQISGALPEPWGMVVMAVVSCVWTIARTWLKKPLR